YNARTSLHIDSWGEENVKRRSLIAVLTVIMLASLVAACGGSGGGSGSGSGDKVTIKMMHLWPEGTSKQQHDLINQIMDEYSDANPHVSFQTEILENEQYKNKLKVLSASNELPDVGFTWAAGFLDPYVKGKMFAPLDDLLAGELKDMFVAGTTEGYAQGGKTYGLPVELNIVPVYYNKAIFEQHGLQPPATYDDLKKIIQTLNDKGVTPIA